MPRLEEIEKRRKSKYYNLSLPWPIVDAIDHLLHNHPELGYTSRGELVREAIRRLLFSVENLKILKELEWIKHEKEVY